MTDHAETPEGRKGPDPLTVRLLVWLGGGALLMAMFADALAVAGRHAGMPLLGSIEIVQAAVLVSGSVSLVMATLAGRHAVVHVLVDRAPPWLKQALGRLANLMCAIFFFLAAGGAAWLAADLWNGHEETELLHIPYAPLRIISIVAAIAAGCACLWASVRGRRDPS